MVAAGPRSAPRRRPVRPRVLVAAIVLVLPMSDALARRCGDEGVWLQILGAGGPALDDQSAVASYLVWVDGRARLLVDAGSGSAVRFGEADADFADLDAIVFTTLTAGSTVDVPAFLLGSARAGRDLPLPLLAPSEGEALGGETPAGQAGARAFFQGMGALYGGLLEGVFQHGATGVANIGYAVRIREVPAIGNRRWARFRSERLALAAMPVHHGGIPALAWRVRAKGFSLVFAGGFSNRRDVVAEFAKDADALVVHHSLVENARGDVLQRYATPSKLGQVAARANARMMILGHRTDATRGRETESSAAIEAHFDGHVLFANDLDCWGM